MIILDDQHKETILAALNDSMSTRGAMTQDEYDRWLIECQAVIAAIEAPGASVQGEWMPVPDGVLNEENGVAATLSQNGSYFEVRNNKDGKTIFVRFKTEKYRLCQQRTPAPALPSPSWQDAPEWANYWAVDADGTWWWHQVEPIMHQTGSACRWDVGCFNGVPQGDWLFGGHIDIPLGIDWRTLKSQRQRPAAQDEVTDGK